MNYLLAISGGVDSVVLLDMMAKGLILASEGEQDQLAVAHIDHGIRDDSGDDRRFCEGLARKYGLEFISTELNLGQHASEELARTRRYEFLFAEAEKRDAVILTAHHADDMAATVAINLHRGTGWRGLAVLSRVGIERPLLTMRKSEIYDYAIREGLEYSEDSTNADLEILRNSLRGQVFALTDEMITKLENLRREQLAISWLVDQEVERLNRLFALKRYPYVQIAATVAIELLRQLVANISDVRPTRIEAERLLLEIKTAKPGSIIELSGGVRVRFERESFVVER